MKFTSSSQPLTRVRRVASVAICAGLFASASLVSAKPIPDNLGYGLDILVESNIAVKEGASKSTTLFNGYATERAAALAEAAISNPDGRFMVDITLTGKVGFEELKASLEKAFPSLEITAVDANYRNVGVIEGWLAVDDAPALASFKGVRAVFLALKPKTNGAGKAAPTFMAESKDAPPTTNFAMLGTKFLQGVTQHRVDKINQFYNPSAPVNYDGEGITVGVLSDSFGTNAAAVTTNVNNFDQPGHPNNPQNTQPIVIIQDYAPGGTDEGRGMTEIVYKMAPKAKIGFATAFTGEVGFANNIRALSGKFPNVPNTRPDFHADVITDDVSYGGEPVFADGGIVANGVDDVFAVGVAYFSSAANSFGVSVYNSDLRMIPNGNGTTAATNTALEGTNVDLTGVPTNLYQGGFHNFNPNGKDVACTWNVSANTAMEIQWDDPYDNSDPVLNQPPVYENNGTINDATVISFTELPPLNAGTKYVITVTATSGNFDAIVSVVDPNGTQIVDQDTGTDEVVTFFPPVTGNYTVRVRRFGTTTGSFNLKINTASGAPLLSTDLNVLAFRLDTGAYVPAASFTSNNYANNRPVENGTSVRPAGVTQLQFVIARSQAPIGPRAATRVRLGTDANSNSANAPAEYFDYNSAVTKGHAIAAGCNGVGAYDVFRPNVPQNFTSGGPALIFFDRNQNLKPTPEVRLQPRMAAANNANSTWQTNNDSGNDIDTGGGQFGGTSAAAPHAAAVAALIMDARGGPGSVTPLQIRSIMQSTTFPHDLDPYQAVGVARASNGGKVTVTVRSDNTATQARGRNDPNSHQIAYIGPSSISTFQFNPAGDRTQGGAVTAGQNGVNETNDYFSNVTPGMYFTAVTATGFFAFTPGASTGLLAADAAFALSNPAPAPANQTAGAQGQTLTLTFAPSSFTGGDIFRFTIGRGIIKGASVAGGTVNPTGASATNYNADLFGGGVFIPEGTIVQDGMRFSGTLADGATFDGRMRNRIGAGFSQLDGFGFVNAEAAVNAPLP